MPRNVDQPSPGCTPGSTNEPTRRRRERFVRSAEVALSLSCMVSASAVAAECDRRLQPIVQPPELAYRDRGDRCEGLYQQPVATTGLRILGFQVDRIANTGGKGIAIHVESTGRKKLTIESLRRRQYYRLDKALEDSARDYFYAFDLVNDPGIKLEPAEIAVRVCLERCDSLEPVLIPALIASAEPGTARQPFITLQATEDLTMMHIEIRTASGDVLLSKDYLQDRKWPAWRPAELSLGAFFAKASELNFRVTARGPGRGQVDVVSATLRSPSR